MYNVSPALEMALNVKQNWGIKRKEEFLPSKLMYKRFDTTLQKIMKIHNGD